jgi:predicted amidophosphoribosyltransferase
MASRRKPRRRPRTTTTICGSCEREWPTDAGRICPECGNDGDIEGHVIREADDPEGGK